MDLTLKNIVVGFISEKDRQAFEQDWRKPHDLEVQYLNAEEAFDLVDPDNKKGSAFKGLLRSVQKHIGGGPSEFLRDVKTMSEDEYLLAFEYHEEESPLSIGDIKESFLRHNVRQAKHFGQYSVEHLTLDPNHREEMPAISG